MTTLNTYFGYYYNFNLFLIHPIKFQYIFEVFIFKMSMIVNYK